MPVLSGVDQVVQGPPIGLAQQLPERLRPSRQIMASSQATRKPIDMTCTP
jgi:hypothetical protein